MENNILYYPTINLPENEWTIKSILYWDTVGVIVPEEYIEEPEQLSRKMRDMVQSGHIVQHLTSDYYSLQYKVSKSILKTVKSKSINLKKCRQNFKEKKASLIHNQKFSFRLFDYLVKNKVAERLESYSFYLVESKIASVMMTYLAIAISKEIKYTPATDFPEYIRENDYLGLVNNQPGKIRSKILGDIMPYPIDVDFNKLIRFKEKYIDQLQRFRIEIEKTVWGINAVKDNESKEKILQLNIDQINDKKEELIARLVENNLGKIAFGAFKGMVVDSGIALITGNVITPAATLLGTINEVVKEYKGNPIKNEDLAFIALMEQRL